MAKVKGIKKLNSSMTKVFKPFGINKFAKIEFKLNPIYQYNYEYIYSYKFNKILNLK